MGVRIAIPKSQKRISIFSPISANIDKTWVSSLASFWFGFSKQKEVRKGFFLFYGQSVCEMWRYKVSAAGAVSEARKYSWGAQILLSR